MLSTTKTLVRKLAHNDASVREEAYNALKSFLKSKLSKKLDLLELEKLWKGLYFSMWYCDKPIPQQSLAGNLGKLFSEVILESCLKDFHEAFWLVILKEWPTIDKWRIDKYLMLIRRVIRHQIFCLNASQWPQEQLDDFLNVLQSLPLSDDPKVPKALSYHICDLFLDEIEYVIFKDFRDYSEESDEDEEDEESDDDDDDEDDEKDKSEKPSLQKNTEKTEEEIRTKKQEILSSTPISKLLEPFRHTSLNAKFKPLREKCKEVLYDDRLKEWGLIKSDDKDDDSDDEEWKGF